VYMSMSLIFPYKSNDETNDFYQSMQYVNENPENNENFGKYIPNSSFQKEIRRTYSYKDMNLLTYEGEMQRNFSTHSLQEYEFETQKAIFRKLHMLEDRSTAGSFSSFTSLNSCNSAANPQNELPLRFTKTKSKNAQSKKGCNGETSYRQKYKTEVCKYWAEKGFCEFGDQCAFAHGNNEIRQKCHVSSNYKTKKCNQFHETGYCPYGMRCQFIHSLRKECQFEQANYTEVMENPDLWLTHDPDCVCMQQKTRRRLPSFQLLSTDENSSNEDNKENEDHNCKK